MRNIMGFAVALLIPVAGFAGCETTKTPLGMGAVSGATAGAVVGSSDGKAAEGALIGGAVGGLTGVVTDEIRKSTK
ncbi:MAG: glycine zipper domain-containing protein [FCB group bacterium]|jgi:hypothetical protein|nr:glycine zipper domain-containing protein [FCB group bacterium]